MSLPEDAREVLVSIATAALLAAEVDARETGQLIFRDEWKPTPRTRNSTPRTYSQATSWLTPILNRLNDLIPPQQDRSSRPAPPPHTQSAPTSPSAPAPPPPRSAPPTSAPQPPQSRPPQSQIEEDVVAKLLKDNIDVYEKLINHPFPQSLGNGTASLDGFRYYMIVSRSRIYSIQIVYQPWSEQQDTFYLETCARIKMLAVARSPNFKDVEIFAKRHESSLEYVKESKKTLISKLGVPEDVIAATPRSKNLGQSEKFYMDAVREDDAYLAFVLPSYWKIAERLMKDPSTVKNVIYHPAWIEVNHDSSSADKYIKFINANLTAKGGSERWHNIFKTACQLESGIFDTGLQVPKPYQIIPNGTYAIRSSSVALANKSVVLRPPLDKRLKLYFPSTAGSSIVGIDKTGENNEKARRDLRPCWHIVVSKDGYTFQNLETGHYLGPATGLNRKDGRILQAAAKPYYWWINSVQDSPLYQYAVLQPLGMKNQE
ncbi:hypothetical protein H0H87_003921 [Tephrocybe sp. NHM501043]|nr:hypothetical protein H0H87_003921 [Tephrocybe sp. NHM501043]